MKKRFAALILTVTVCLGLVFTTAWATDAMDDSASGTSKIITGFEELRDYYLSFDSKPPLTELMSQLPSEINVYLEGEDTAVAIPVTWESEQDYTESNEAYYLFWAVWDDGYELSDGYDIEAYRPFFEVEINESQSNENQPTNYRSASSSGIDHIVARAYQQLQVYLRKHWHSSKSSTSESRCIRPGTMARWNEVTGRTIKSSMPAISSIPLQIMRKN